MTRQISWAKFKPRDDGGMEVELDKFTHEPFNFTTVNPTTLRSFFKAKFPNMLFTIDVVTKAKRGDPIGFNIDFIRIGKPSDGGWTGWVSND